METWKVLDHKCRYCGGRILGRDGAHRCASCNARDESHRELCWCGFSYTGRSDDTPFACVPYAILGIRPELLPEFQACGCDPRDGTEIGILRVENLYAAH